MSGNSSFSANIKRCKQEKHRANRYNRILEGINRIFSYAVKAKTEEELGNACLSVAMEVTASQIGFVGEVGYDGLLHDIAVSDVGWNQCKIHDKTGHRRHQGDFIPHGLYGRVIDSKKGFFTNDPQSHSDSIGVPPGHPSLTSFLGVPLIEEGEAVGMLAVANRQGDYNFEQLEDLEFIAPAVTQVLKRKKEEKERKQAEEALREAHDGLEVIVKERTAELEKACSLLKEGEQLLAEAQRIAHIGSWEWNIAANKLYWSDEVYRIFGRNPQEFEPAHNAFFDYIHPEDREYVDHAIKEALNRKPYDIDYRIVSPDGEERIVYSQGGAIFDEQSTPIRMRGIVQDITDRKKSEERIRNLANIVESSNDAIGTISLEGIITSWNKGAEQVYGYSVEEILGKPISFLAPPHLEYETKKLIELIKQGEKVHYYETMRLRKDGKLIDVSITLSPVFCVHGKLTAVSFISRDITKRKTVEEKLRESEEKYRNIVETANEGILITDDRAIITYVNRKMVEMLGYTSEENFSRPIWDFISEDYKPIVKLNLEKRMQGVSDSYELKLIHKDGSLLWTLLNAKPLIDKEGKYMGAMSMVTDITGLKKAEDALVNYEANRKKEIHHRIKNNLQVISSLLDLQADKFKSKKSIKVSEVLEAFKESQDRVLSMALIHEELHKSGETDIIDFPEYIEELADNLFLTYRLGNNEIKLDTDFEENIYFEMDIAVPLGIIINELISNSLKYAFTDRDKGEIRIGLHKENNGECSEDCSTAYVLSVSDNGVGIPEDLDIEDLDSLGLQLVISLVEQLDGELEIKRNKGTEFTVRFTISEKSNQVSMSAPQLNE